MIAFKELRIGFVMRVVNQRKAATVPVLGCRSGHLILPSLSAGTRLRLSYGAAAYFLAVKSER